MSGSHVPRPLRAVNLVALLLFLAGAVVYARAWIGMRGLRDHQPDPAAAPFSAMAQFNHYWILSRVALWLVAAAAAVAVLATVAALIHQRRQGATTA